MSDIPRIGLVLYGVHIMDMFNMVSASLSPVTLECPATVLLDRAIQGKNRQHINFWPCPLLFLFPFLVIAPCSCFLLLQGEVDESACKY